MFAAIAGILLPFMPSILNLVEGLFKRQGEKTGPVKLSAALEMLKKLLETMKKDGKLTDLPNDDTLRGFIETIVQQLNLTGQLTGTAPTVQPGMAATGVYLVRGSIVDLTKV